MGQAVSGKASLFLKMAFSFLWTWAVSRSDAWKCCNHLVTLRRSSLDDSTKPLSSPIPEPTLPLSFSASELMAPVLSKVTAALGTMLSIIWEDDNFPTDFFLYKEICPVQ